MGAHQPRILTSDPCKCHVVSLMQARYTSRLCVENKIFTVFEVYYMVFASSPTMDEIFPCRPEPIDASQLSSYFTRDIDRQQGGMRKWKGNLRNALQPLAPRKLSLALVSAMGMQS